MNSHIDEYKNNFEEKFSWRKDEYIENMKRLAEISKSYGIDPFKAFPSLFVPMSDNPIDALRYSVLMLTYEATICFIFGIFQSCILTCGSIVERVLKLEYLEKNQQFPKNGNWTLGHCIYKLNWTDTRISPEILDFAKQIVEPRNSRIHGLLENSDPQLSIMGGKNRGIRFLSSTHYMIEPYRGEAEMLITIVFEILTRLYLKET
ncbi:MAG: hypothetical protein ABFC34_03190 [Methanobacterium sp.]